jgi:hypothetical protein
MKISHRLSEFVKSLGRYERPEPGEELLTEYGKARVLRVVPYEEVVEEMTRDLVASKEIERFTLRVRHFLGDTKRYFECELANLDGEIGRIDWSEYLALKNGRKR